MATRTYKFYGIANWAKVHTPDQTYGHYGLDLTMDKPSWDMFKKSGVQLKIKDKDGEKFVTFRRDPTKVFEGQSPKPKVMDAAGREIEDLVGNGSKVAVVVSVYDTRKGKGHRLEEVIVIDLVPYSGGVEDAHGDYDEEGDYDAHAQEEAPRATAKVKPKAKVAEGDDELPF